MKQLFKIENIIKKEVYLHLLFWMFYVSLPFIKYIGNDYFFTQWILNNSNTPLVMLTTYCCYYFIFPLKNNYKIIILVGFLGIMTIIGVFTSKYIIDIFIHQLGNYTLKSHIFSTLSEYILVCLIFYALYAVKKSYQLSTALKTAELKNLKSQINPHFLFNTLNNIYSYSIQNDKKASELILKLSDNFKYVFHEGQNEKVELRKDWEHLKDFISINKYRWEDKLTFEISEDFESKNHLISPLILITFIENAVKYTSKQKGNNHIISIAINIQNNELFFKCSNPCNSTYSLENEWESSGLGLKNTMKRLDLLYPKKHSLIIEESETMFVITLKMTLC